MNENNNNNNGNEVEQIEITKTNTTVPFSARVHESDKRKFKEEMIGTDSEKLRKLIEAYEKQKENEDSFTLTKEITYIQRAVDTIVSNLNAINRNVNEQEVYLREKYVEGFGEQLKEIESRLTGEEILQARITNLENINQNLISDKEKNEVKIDELNEKIEGLEEENTKYVALNTEIVSRENNYISQLHEKDNALAEKELQLRDLKSENIKKIAELEESYKVKLQELQNELEQTNKKYVNSIAEANKEKSVMETKIDSLQENVEGLKLEKDVLNATLKEAREQYKAEIKDIETGYKQEMKELENKLDAERKVSDNEVKELRNQHKAELESIKDEYKENIKLLEGKTSEAQKETTKTEIKMAKLEAKLEAKVESETNLKQEIDVLKEKLRIAEEKNKKLKEEIEDK
jgi:chromosome segregation ATPase